MGRGCIGVGVSVCVGVFVGGWVDEGVLIRFVIRSLLGERMCWGRGECVWGCGWVGV